MHEYIVRNTAGKFVARVLASSPEDAAQVIHARMGDESIVPTGEAIYIDFETAAISISDLFDPLNPFRDLQITEQCQNKPAKLKGLPCVYCDQGTCTSVEGDHVIARGFFDEAKRNNTIVYIRVPACDKCNGLKSHGETYVIPLLSLNTGPEHPDAASLTAPGGPVHRLIDKVPEVWESLVKGARQVFVPSEDGTHLLQTVALGSKWGLVDRVVQMITKGLYYHHTGSRFPETHEIVVSCATSDTFGHYTDLALSLKHAGPISLGDGVFNYLYVTFDDDDATTLWLMSFYGHYDLVVKTLPLKVPGQLLEVTKDVPFAKAGHYVLRTYSGNKAELSHAVRVDDSVHTTGERITVSRHQLVVFLPTGISVEMKQ